MTVFVTLCFVAVYLGMMFGGVPGLRIDRTGVALLGNPQNILVGETARREGVAIDVRTHARVGVPVTLATLAIAWSWLVFTLQGS